MSLKISELLPYGNSKKEHLACIPFLRTTHNFPDDTIVLFCGVTILISQDPLQQDCSMMRRLNFVFRHVREARAFESHD